MNGSVLNLNIRKKFSLNFFSSFIICVKLLHLEQSLYSIGLHLILWCPFLPQQTAKSDLCLTSPYNIMPWITRLGHENKGNDHLLDKLLIIKQILLDSTTGCLWRTVWRLCILMLGCKGLLLNELAPNNFNSVASFCCCCCCCCFDRSGFL